MRNHYKAQTYLKGFADLNDFIWQYDVQQKSFIPNHSLNVANAGLENDLWYDPFEKDLIQIEGGFNSAFRNILSWIDGNIESPSVQDIRNLAQFISLQGFISPDSKRFLNDKVKLAISKLKLEHSGIYSKNPMNRILDFFMDPEKLFHNFANDFIGKVLSKLIKSDWVFLVSPSEYHFITSDKALVVTVGSPLDHGKEADLLDPENGIIFPLCKSICLMVSPMVADLPTLTKRNVGIERLSEINLAVLENASKFVFSYDKESVLSSP